VTLVRSLRALHAAGVAVCALGACTAASGADDTAGTAVVVSSYPLQYVAEAVGRDHVSVRNLVPPGGDTHGAEPAPQDVAALTDADVVVHQSGGLQPAIDDVVAQQRPEHLVDAGDLADRNRDPHFWLDPLRMAELGNRVADRLGEADPEHADDYAAAADDLAAALRALDGEFTAGLAGCRGATLVATHEAYGYLADRYGLRQIGVAGLDPQVEPSPARLRDVAEAVRESGARTIYFETEADPRVAAALAEELDLGTDHLHPVEQVQEGQTYPQLMRDNLAALERGLTCG
jgi:zinc transport system substrate-binding protein